MDVFLSYSRNDSNFVLRLAGSLREKGVKIWLDQTDIPTGNRWDTEIEKALANCHTILVVLSPDSTNSQNVLDEVSYALEEGKRIIPILFKKSVIPFRLRRFQYTDFTADFDDAIYKLLEHFELPKPKSKPQIQVNEAPKSASIIDTGKIEKASNLERAALKIDKISHSLKRLISEGGDGNYAIFLINSEKNYYMQAKAEKGDNKIYVEIVGNSYLAHKDRLTQNKINLIMELGWEGKKEENFGRFFEVVPADKFDHAINAIAMILEVVFGVKSEKDIKIELALE